LLVSSGKKALLLGNIGVPPFDLADSIEEHTTVVFEMSAHQLENVKHAPHIAVLLNVFPEHLDHFGDFEAYRRAKYNIFKYQLAEDIAIMHQGFACEVKGKSLLFGDENTGETDVVVRENELVFTKQDLTLETDPGRQTLIGKHNLLNMAAALLGVQAAGVHPETAFEHIASFSSLPHRLEFVGKYGDTEFYNDSISTVPESTLAAVEALGRVKTLILGGYDRGLDYGQMVAELNESDVEHFIFLGKAGEVMRRIFEELSSSKDLLTVADIDEAVAYAMENTGKGICLLSPAAASYDQFHNFEHRGNAFKKALHKKSGS
jgi:UDP-N-acetylmuramoylalanine--D-glutamate ligase